MFESTVATLLAWALLSTIPATIRGNPITPSTTAIDNTTLPEFVIRYAPIVYLHSQDPYLPSDLLIHLQHTTPKLNFESIADVPPLDLDNLALLNIYGDDGGTQVYLTSNDDVTSPGVKWLRGAPPDTAGRIHNATPCVVIVVDRGPRDVDVFYFYFYSYDQGANITQVLPPMDRLLDDTTNGKHFGDHVGDWEHNMIRFRDQRPTGIYYSQHSDGREYGWDDGRVSKEDGRPVVYSAIGSHANYANTGTHVHDEALLDYCDKGPLWDTVQAAYFYRYNPSTRTVIPFTNHPLIAPNTTAPTSWFEFTGLWGDKQYPDTDPRQKTVPHFGLKRFKSGPNGPRFKQLLRKGLSPIRSRKPFMVYAVRVYMKLYALGFRPWILMVVLALAAVAVVLYLFWRLGGGERRCWWQGIGFGWRRWKYQRLKVVVDEEDEMEMEMAMLRERRQREDEHRD